MAARAGKPRYGFLAASLELPEIARLPFGEALEKRSFQCCSGVRELMRVLIYSDLHLEFRGFEPPRSMRIWWYSLEIFQCAVRA